MKINPVFAFLVLALGIAAVWSVNAVAGGINNEANSGSYADSASLSGSASYATGGVSGATSGAANAGNAQTVNVTSPGTVKYSGDYTVKSTPDVTNIIPSMTAPCYVSTGIAGSGAGFGFGVASGIEDKGCTAREDARTLLAMGLKDEAIARLCQREEMAKSLGPKCGIPSTLPAESPQVSYNPATRTTTVREMNGWTGH